MNSEPPINATTTLDGSSDGLRLALRVAQLERDVEYYRLGKIEADAALSYIVRSLASDNAATKALRTSEYVDQNSGSYHGIDQSKRAHEDFNQKLHSAQDVIIDLAARLSVESKESLSILGNCSPSKDCDAQAIFHARRRDEEDKNHLSDPYEIHHDNYDSRPCAGSAPGVTEASHGPKLSAHRDRPRSNVLQVVPKYIHRFTKADTPESLESGEIVDGPSTKSDESSFERIQRNLEHLKRKHNVEHEISFRRTSPENSVHPILPNFATEDHIERIISPAENGNGAPACMATTLEVNMRDETPVTRNHGQKRDLHQIEEGTAKIPNKRARLTDLDTHWPIPAWKLVNPFISGTISSRAVQIHNQNVGPGDIRFPDIFRYGLFYDPPGKTESVYRTVIVSGLTAGTSPTMILDQIHSGVIVDIKLVDTNAISNSGSAMITFFTEASATKFAGLKALLIDGIKASISLVPTPTWPLPVSISNWIEKANTRCLKIDNIPDTQTESEILEDLHRCWGFQSSTLEYMSLREGTLILRLTSVKVAKTIASMFTTLQDYTECKIHAMEDPCAAKYGDVKHGQDDEIQATQGTIDAASQGATASTASTERLNKVAQEVTVTNDESTIITGLKDKPKEAKVDPSKPLDDTPIPCAKI